MQTSRVAGCTAALLAATACFTAVGDPDYWDPRRMAHAHPDGGSVFVNPGDEPGGPGCPQVDCSSYGGVDSLDGVLGIVQGQPWSLIAKKTSICLPASNDLSVTRTVNLRATDVTLPSQCAAPGMCTGLTFKVTPGALGVTCLDQFCTALMLSGANFRVRQLVRDQYPTSPRYVPVVEVMAPCGTPCDATELTCEVNHTCWPSLVDHCRFCVDAPHEQCVCVNHTEGETCLVYLSNDLSCVGVCNEGSCTIKSGQPGCPVPK